MEPLSTVSPKLWYGAKKMDAQRISPIFISMPKRLIQLLCFDSRSIFLTLFVSWEDAADFFNHLFSRRSYLAFMWKRKCRDGRRRRFHTDSIFWFLIAPPSLLQCYYYCYLFGIYLFVIRASPPQILTTNIKSASCHVLNDNHIPGLRDVYTG